MGGTVQGELGARLGITQERREQVHGWIREWW